MNWPTRPQLLKGGGWDRGIPMMPYCLSHVPAAGCMVDHHCTDAFEKQVLAHRALELRLGWQARDLPIYPVVEKPLPASKDLWFCKGKRPWSWR